jgi:hypothetical protein
MTNMGKKTDDTSEQKPKAANAKRIMKLEAARHKHAERWREAIEREVQELWKVRQHFRHDDKGFQRWLDKHKVEVPLHDRQVLIAIGRSLKIGLSLESDHKPLHEVIANFSLFALDTIWQAIEQRELVEQRMMGGVKEQHEPDEEHE